jgi:leader peptidase (prepilin peptidase)/N-methyltransferase
VHLLQVLTFVIGATIGSFLNVVIARLPEGQSVARPGSHCPSCKTPIKPWHNIPLLSWLLLRGKCASCGTPISFRYFVVELLTGALFLACLQRFGLTWALAPALILSASLVAITFIDIDTFEIADEISLPGIALGCLLRPLCFDKPWFSGIVGALLGAAFLGFIRWAHMVVRKREGMGLGDVKLIAMIGAFLGPGGLLPTIFVGAFAGSIIGGVVVLGRKLRGEDKEAEPEPEPEATESEPEVPEAESEVDADEDDDWEPSWDAVPFGPFLALGALAALLFQPAFERLLLGLQLLYRY